MQKEQAISNPTMNPGGTCLQHSDILSPIICATCRVKLCCWRCVRAHSSHDIENLSFILDSNLKTSEEMLFYIQSTIRKLEGRIKQEGENYSSIEDRLNKEQEKIIAAFNECIVKPILVKQDQLISNLYDTKEKYTRLEVMLQGHVAALKSRKELSNFDDLSSTYEKWAQKQVQSLKSLYELVNPMVVEIDHIDIIRFVLKSYAESQYWGILDKKCKSLDEYTSLYYKKTAFCEQTPESIFLRMPDQENYLSTISVPEIKGVAYLGLVDKARPTGYCKVQRESQSDLPKLNVIRENIVAASAFPYIIVVGKNQDPPSENSIEMLDLLDESSGWKITKLNHNNSELYEVSGVIKQRPGELVIFGKGQDSNLWYECIYINEGRSGGTMKLSFDYLRYLGAQQKPNRSVSILPSSSVRDFNLHFNKKRLNNMDRYYNRHEHVLERHHVFMNVFMRQCYNNPQLIKPHFDFTNHFEINSQCTIIQCTYITRIQLATLPVQAFRSQ
eukprot:TRINITY_DN1706_c0_g1_i2.p1 TRINITY_DN1706_c0_g1~~TRINITY_DN1706_c0_g1_i2.p1  ORF type:complete len:501 (+),score=14.29 TRINITY_DN1706_c0_g1_i2:502-2004(+)